MTGISAKRTLRAGLDGVLAITGLTRRFHRAMNGRATLLMYHRVLPDEQANRYPIRELAVPRSCFIEQVRWLARHFDVRTVGQWRASIAGTEDARRDPGRSIVCVTFDDGYLDNYEIAAPILEQYGLRGSFFLTAGHIGTDRLFWYDHAALHWQRSTVDRLEASIAGVDLSAAVPADYSRSALSTLDGWLRLLKILSQSDQRRVLDRLDEHFDVTPYADGFRAMRPQHAADLHRRGHEIASHTMTHPILPNLSDDELRDELADSRRLITDWTGEPPAGFCYPNGDLDDRVVAAVRDAGYAWACTTRPGANAAGADPMRLRRQPVFESSVTGCTGRHSEQAFAAEISGLHQALRQRLSRRLSLA